MNEQDQAEKVASNIFQSKFGLAKIAYDGYRLSMLKEYPNTDRWEELSHTIKMAWARAVLRVEAETVLRITDKIQHMDLE